MVFHYTRQMFSIVQGNKFMGIWGLFDRATSSWNKEKCQLDTTTSFYWCILSSTCFGYIRPSSGALDIELQEGKRQLGRPRRRWVVNIKMDLQEVGCGHVDWIGLAQDRDRWRTLVSAVMNFRLPWNAGNFLTSCKPVSFSRRTLHHGVNK